MKDYWRAYIHSNGTLHFTRSFSEGAIKLESKSPYIKQFFDPWLCESIEEAKIEFATLMVGKGLTFFGK